MLGSIVQHVQKYLPQPLAVTGNFRNIGIVFQILQGDSVLGKTTGIHIHRVLKFAADVCHFHIQCHSAILHPGEVQQLRDHDGQALCFAGNNLHALARLVTHVVIRQQRLAPAVDDRQRGAQLVGQLGDKFPLHFFILADFGGHLVDGVRQLPNFIVIPGLNLNAVAAVGNSLCLLGNLRHRHHDGLHKEAAAEQHHHHEHKQHRQRNTGHIKNLLVDHPGGGNKPERPHHLAAGVNERAGNGDDVFVRNGVDAHEGLCRAGAQCLGNLRGHRRFVAPQAIGAGHQGTGFVQELQLDDVPRLIAAGIGDAGLIVVRKILIEIVGKEITGGFGSVAQVCLHIGIIIRRIRGRDRRDAHQPQGKNHTEGIDQPTVLQAMMLFLLLTHSALCAPFIAETPNSCDIGGVCGIVFNLNPQTANVYVHDF